MLRINWPSINADNDDDYHEALMDRQVKADRNYDTLRNYKSIPIESTVVVQREDVGPCIHGIIEEKGESNYNGR